MAGGIGTFLMQDPRDLLRRSTVRIGVTGLARSGKTVLLTALAATLLSSNALGGRIRGAQMTDAGTDGLPRFPYRRMRDALAADPPDWPRPTDGPARLSLTINRREDGLFRRRPLKVEFLDYPGEWLVDLPMLGQSYAAWSRETFARMATLPSNEDAQRFQAFATALPSGMDASDAQADIGHALYSAALRSYRAKDGVAYLQPGRFLMPAPGAPPAWMAFFPLPEPHANESPFFRLMAARYDSYLQALRDMLISPHFSRIDRLVVLSDLLGALHGGPKRFEDTQHALHAVCGALTWRRDWGAAFSALMRGSLPPPSLDRVALVASKADHVAARQRGNLAALMGALCSPSVPEHVTRRHFAVASIRCTEDFVWTLDGHPVSAVRGRIRGENRLTRSYPGEVPAELPDAAFWAHPFLSLPDFEPARLPVTGNDVPNIGLEPLLSFLLEGLI